MISVFLDSSVLIGLHFRHAGERASCEACIPQDSQQVTSRYVVFEVARGFLRSLIELHNFSFEFNRFSELHQAAYSGQRRFRQYQMHTWLGAMTDFMAALENDGGEYAESQKLELLRAKLRTMIQRGWRKLIKTEVIINEVHCLRMIPEPSLNKEGRLVQALPVTDCGKPNVCGILQFVVNRREIVQNLINHLENLPADQKGTDTDKKHVSGLRHLLETSAGEEFKGKKCHACGDAIICLETPEGSIIATKNLKDFKPIAEHLEKGLVIAETAKRTNAPSSPA